ncbi:MAG: nicotinic acid mononucleotide adenylyltransferase [Chloroflexi bacterium B3_Chlor]|nr:MAG: nicotinic acid mononucleotide adenylyltransferase [Chloroflexi bacterium B3_Chlor]
MRRIGVIGGTFDPIHYGHLAAAEEARVKMDLERVLFVVAGVPPHKLDEEITPVEHRLAIVSLAIASNTHFEISRVDVDRPGPSYTVDTISILQKRWGQDTEICFIMGLDSLVELPTWHQPKRLIQSCRLVAVSRPGVEIEIAELEASVPGISSRVEIIDMPEMDISSTELQQRVRDGLPIKYQVPEEVERYIMEHELYRRSSGTAT